MPRRWIECCIAVLLVDPQGILWTLHDARGPICCDKCALFRIPLPVIGVCIIGLRRLFVQVVSHRIFLLHRRIIRHNEPLNLRQPHRQKQLNTLRKSVGGLAKTCNDRVKLVRLGRRGCQMFILDVQSTGARWFFVCISSHSCSTPSVALL